MKSIFLLCGFLFLGFQAQAHKNCEMTPDFPIRYIEGSSPSHEAKTKFGTVRVGSAGDEVPGDLDRLAVQRSLISCAPGALKCLKETGLSQAKLWVSFVLTTNGETTTAKDWSLSASPQLDSKLSQCLGRVFVEARFGLLLSRPSLIKIQFEMK